MQPYTDVTRVRAAISRTLESRPGTAASVEETTLLTAINSAQTTIDARLGVLFSTPFEPVPQLITDIATALAAWDADLTFREVRDYASELNPVLLRYKWADGMLTALSKGQATIPGYDPVPSETDPGGGDVVAVYNPDLCAVELDTSSCCGYEDRYYGRC